MGIFDFNLLWLFDNDFVEVWRCILIFYVEVVFVWVDGMGVVMNVGVLLCVNV